MAESTESTEPAVNTGIVTSLATSVYVIINAIFPNLLSTDVQNAITQIALMLIPVIMSFIIRGKVYSPATVARLLDQKR